MLGFDRSLAATPHPGVRASDGSRSLIGRRFSMEASTLAVELKPWQVSSKLFPGRDAHPNLILRSFVHWAVLAPSSMNTQPWWFRTEDGVLELHADRTRALPVSDPNDRELTIACGAALFNLCIACRHFGFLPIVERFPDAKTPDLLATIRLGVRQDPTGDENRLFVSIPRRRTHGMPFDEKPIEESVLHSLEQCTKAEHAWCHVVADFSTKHQIAELVAESDRVQFQDRRYRRELALWSHPNRSHSKDGMPGHERGIGDLASILDPFILRFLNTGASEARKDHRLAKLAPALAVIGTAGDSPFDWLHAGEALEHALLVATSAGYSASFLNQPMHLDAMRPKLAKLLDERGHPQMLIRLGHGKEVKPTPRRCVEEVMRVT